MPVAMAAATVLPVGCGGRAGRLLPAASQRDRALSNDGCVHSEGPAKPASKLSRAPRAGKAASALHAPEGGGAVQPVQMFAHPPFASGQHLVVPFEDADPGVSGWAAGSV